MTSLADAGAHSSQDREERIRQRAHQLWEADGRPEGRHDHHWSQAEREINDAEPAHGTPVAPGSAIPDVRSADPAGMPDDKRPPVANDSATAPASPKMSGAAKPARDRSKSPVANRDTEGPRKAGATARPTDKPLA
ncbi:MAG: DUF2934 domain-containing protein [Rhizobiaceae bacterium]